MPTEVTHRDAEEVAPFSAGWSWQSGGVAGFLATLAMGVAITVGDLAVLREAIAGLYTFEGNLLVGWAVHLLHGTVFGMVFALVLSDPGLHRIDEWAWKTVLAGVVFGLVLALAGAGVIMPI